MKITNNYVSIQQPETKSEVSKYKGPDSGEHQVIVLPEETVDSLEARNAGKNFSLRRLS